MSGISGIEEFLTPISDQSPCGNYLKLDRSVYRGLRNTYNAAQSSFRQLIETPDASADQLLLNKNQTSWLLLRDTTQDALLKKTKDIEILGWNISSQLFTEQPFDNLAKALTILQVWVEQYWDDLHPKPPEEKLKAETEQDKLREWTEFRTRPLLQLVGESPDSTALYVPLQMQAIIGDITFGDYLKAELDGSLARLKEQANQQFSNTTMQVLQQLVSCYHALAQTEKLVAEKCSQAGVTLISFKFIKANFKELISAIEFLVGERFSPWPLNADLGPISQPEPSQAPQAIAASQPMAKQPNTEPAPSHKEIGSMASNLQSDTGINAPAQTISNINGITNRDHAFQEIRKIAQYFEQTEPHSPVAFLLERAIRWGYLSLPELMQEMIGEEQKAFNQINQLTGMDHLEKLDLSDKSSDRANPTSTQINSAPELSIPGSEHSSEPQGSDNPTHASSNTQATSGSSSASVSDFKW